MKIFSQNVMLCQPWPIQFRVLGRPCVKIKLDDDNNNDKKENVL